MLGSGSEHQATENGKVRSDLNHDLNLTAELGSGSEHRATENGKVRSDLNHDLNLTGL